MNRASLAAGALRWARPDPAGVLFATVFFCLSLTPSLPRDWLNSGIIGGINAAIGYGIGILIGRAFGFFLRSRVWYRRAEACGTACTPRSRRWPRSRAW